jgi:hypothetical protein
MWLATICVLLLGSISTIFAYARGRSDGRRAAVRQWRRQLKEQLHLSEELRGRLRER